MVHTGERGQLAIVTGHENWADFQPHATTFYKMLNEVYGKECAEAIFKKFDSAVRGIRSEIWRYDPGLSYIVANKIPESRVLPHKTLHDLFGLGTRECQPLSLFFSCPPSPFGEGDTFGRRRS